MKGDKHAQRRDHIRQRWKRISGVSFLILGLSFLAFAVALYVRVRPVLW